ncbi:Importin-13 [Eumeta japonica]|uniref:Importin-13 n=1 Tax=Eumeta variegata TaxID=151549 RepID=A0A4C1V2S7_EUMVA|nr:Importin-13 [Eumeta japonica]
MEFTVPNLEYAVSVFYNSEQNERIQAHQWLTAAQRCPEAWIFVWELLQSNKGTEVQFFAATTLHTKLLRFWHEVPPENHEELKDKILQAILAFAQGPKIVLNRLCISLAAYIMRQGTVDLATILRPLSSEENFSILLEVLTVIPEEFNSMTMGTALRTSNRAILQRACPAVLDDMLRHLQSVYKKEMPSEELIESWYKASTCAASWLAFGCQEDSVREEGTCTATLNDCLPLCHALLQVVHVLYIFQEPVSDTALEACEAALGAVRAAGASPDAPRYPNAALQLLTALTILAQPLIARDNVPNSQNEELLAAIVTCAVALGECHTRALVNAVEQSPPQEGAKQFLEMLLTCQGAPGHYPLHETRSQLVFGFWYTLQDEVLNILDSTKHVNEVWRVVFTRLLNSLIEKSEAPPDDALSRDDAELLRCYRQDIADTVMYCYGILGEECWGICSAAWDAGGARREAALHVTAAFADVAPPRQPPHLADVLRHAVHAVNTTLDTRLLSTALDCLGAYAFWLSTLEGSDKEVGACLAREALQAAGSALSRAPQSAALALKKLSTECGALAAPLARDIAIAAQSEVVRADAWVRRQLLAAAGAALAAATEDVAHPLLQQLSLSLFKDLQKEAENPSAGCGAAEAAGALLGALSPRPDYAAQLFQRLLPALPPYAENVDLVQPLFIILKQAISVLMDECLPWLEDVSQLMLVAINVHPCPSGVDVIQLTVLMFGSQSACCERLFRTCIVACARTCAQDSSSNSDLTEAMFEALHSITKKKPQYLCALGDTLPQVVELGCNCVRLWEANASRAACGWLAALADAHPQSLLPHAPRLTASAVQCIGGLTPRNQVSPLVELLLALNRAQWGGAPDDHLGHWLRAALAEPNFPTPHATQQHKQRFLAAVLK